MILARTRREPTNGSPDSRDPARLRPRIVLPLLLGTTLAFSLWLLRLGAPGADEGAILTNAVKLLHGAVYYRDVDAYPFPLATYLLAAWIAVFGEHLTASRVLAALVQLVVVASFYLSALRLIGWLRATVFGLLLIVLTYLGWPAFTAFSYYHLALALGSLCLGATLCRPADHAAWLAAAGCAAGLTILSKQNLGIYFTAAACGSVLLDGLWFSGRTGWPSTRRNLTILLAAAAGPLALAFALAYSAGVLPQMVESGFLRPFSSYLRTSSVPFLTPLAWWEFGSMRGVEGAPYLAPRLWRLLELGPLHTSPHANHLRLALELLTRVIYTAVSVAFLAGALAVYRLRYRPEVRDLSVIALFSGAAFLSALPRADYTHVVAVYPVILLFQYKLWSLLPASRRRLEVGLLGLAGLLLVTLAVVDERWHGHRLGLARAHSWVSPEEAWIESVVRYVETQTRPGDPVFMYGVQADLYFLTGRRSGWPFAQLYPGQTGEDGGRSLVQFLEREQPRLLLRGILHWPGMPPITRDVPLLEEHIAKHWERIPDVYARFPIGNGPEPPGWLISVLRPCATGRCDLPH